MAARRSSTSLLTEIWTGLAAASGIGYLATAYAVSRWLTRTSRWVPRPPDPDPQITWDEWNCRTADGLCLRGWVVTPPRPAGTVAVFHGLRGHRDKIRERIAFLAGAGYRCVAFDHRAHGQSQGRRTSFGFYESRDVAAVLGLIRRHWPEQPHAALGISMGAAALCFAADHARHCQALILESPYPDLASAFQTRLGQAYPNWFERFRPGVIWMTERRLKLRLAQLAPIRHVAALAPAAILLLTGEDDPHASPAKVRQFFDHCSGPREMTVISGAGHANVWEIGGQYYQERILDFLRRRLSAP